MCKAVVLVAMLWANFVCVERLAGLEVSETPNEVTVQGKGYRARFWRQQAEFEMDVHDGQGQIRPVLRGSPEFAFVSEGIIHSTFKVRANWEFHRIGSLVAVGWNCPLLPSRDLFTQPVWATIHFVLCPKFCLCLIVHAIDAKGQMRLNASRRLLEQATQRDGGQDKVGHRKVPQCIAGCSIVIAKSVHLCLLEL